MVPEDSRCNLVQLAWYQCWLYSSALVKNPRKQKDEISLVNHMKRGMVTWKKL